MEYVYANLVRNGDKVIEQVPTKNGMREKVEVILAQWAEEET